MNREEAKKVLLDNTRTTPDGKRYTVPSGTLYPHQWAWDSAFIAIGFATFDVERALEELETLFSRQWADGRVPHIVFWHTGSSYFPGPAEWGLATSSSITNPMVFAMALEQVTHRADGSYDERLRALAERIERAHAFIVRERDPLGIGAVACAHPWESGRDNCVAWDDALSAVNTTGVDVSGRTDKEKVDDPAERPSDDAYRGYLALVYAIRDGQFGPGCFAVYDPFLTALMYRSEQALLRLRPRLGFATEAAARSARLHAALHTELFDEARGVYVNLNAQNRVRQHHDTLAALQPLAADPPAEHAARLESTLARFRSTPYCAPTLSPASDAFESVRYWRGPLWANMNWLSEPFIGEGARSSVLRLIASHGFREYFDPIRGEGLGARQFSWSAALCLDWWSRDR